MRSTHRRGRRTSPTVQRDRWLISYADFITLLFAFFTTLYAASTVDRGKLNGVAIGLQDAFDLRAETAAAKTPSPSGGGVLDAGRGIVGRGTPDAKEAVETELGDALRLGQIELTRDTRGLILTVPEAGAFPVGQSDLSDTARQVMASLAEALGRLPNPVRIEGHTDDVPIRGPKFRSNWELSTARATSVVEFLVEEGRIAPSRLSAAGYSQFHPVAPNDSAEHRARNRRVDIIIMNPEQAPADNPALQPGQAR